MQYLRRVFSITCEDIMGWTSFTIDKTDKTSDIVKKELTQLGGPNKTAFEIIDSAMVGSTFYGIQRVTRPDGSTIHFGIVVLTTRKKIDNLSNDIAFSYKDMSEDCGPYYYECPIRILDKLDLLDTEPNGPARAWRAKCRSQHAIKAAKRAEKKQFKRDLLQALVNSGKLEILRVKL
jgi:hypothetical protein